MQPTPDDVRREIESALKISRANEELVEMAHTDLAKLYWFRYKALCEVGFSEAQALDILKARGLEA